MGLVPFLAGMCLLLGLSAFFSGSETALFSLTAGQVHYLAAGHPRLGHLVNRLRKDPEALLITLLIGNMAVNVTYFAMASVATLWMKRGGSTPGWVLSAWAVGALIVLVLAGEVAPKVVAFSYPRWVSRLVAVPLFVVHETLRPAHRLLRSAVVRPLTRLARPEEAAARSVSIDELRELLAVSERRGVLHADETSILHEILGLSQIKVRDIMVPRVQILAFDIRRPAAELLQLLRGSARSAVPVFRADLDHILGWAYARRVFLEPDRPLAELLLPVRYVPELATVEQLLHDFRRTRSRIAVVVDEYGGTAGLVTLEDVLEEIVGEIQDVQTPVAQPLVKQVGPAEYDVSGQLPIHDWSDTFGQAMDDPRLVTVGGLVIKLLGRMPRVGDRVRYGNVMFTVQATSGRRIERLRLMLQPAGGGGGEQP